MTDSLYLTSIEAGPGLAAIARQLLEHMADEYTNVGLFRPFINGAPEDDPILNELGPLAGNSTGWGTTRDHYIEDEPSAMSQVISHYRSFQRQHDAVLLVGLADGDPQNPGLIARSGRMAANLGVGVGLFVNGENRSQDRLIGLAELAVAELISAHAPVSAVFVTHSTDEDHEVISAEIDGVPVTSDGNDPRAIEAMKKLTTVMTPLAFQNDLMDAAQAERKTIVLPEPEDDRVLQAASLILSGGVADIIFVGEEDTVRAAAEEKGYDISAAKVVSVNDESYLERYAEEFARLRAKKGVTLEQARETLRDVSYFGTMMVHMGDADGMVSGAAHTTAHTIVPSFQIIKTKPGVSIVSSVFLMLMRDRVLVYGDCAVNTNPTPEQLADIAISSAESAKQFKVEPKIAMLSYSTGDSGSGEDVDKVRKATELVRERRPDLMIEGPIQYDAAVDPTVASKKLPDSPVAGKANVFIFPDLDAANIGYKAVQRSSGAVAVGPILQGLNKPINDLSRGALVNDIVNTVAITAVQAGQAE